MKTEGQLSDRRAFLTIDLKKKRIRIYKQTLRMLGDPEQILFLVNEKRKILAIRAGEPTDPLAQKIHWDFLTELGQCCEFYSTYLVENLENRILGDRGERSLRAAGEWDDALGAVLFNLSETEPLGDGTA